MPGPLGRRVPKDWDHLDKYPLTALAPEGIPTGVPMSIGISWYTDFDRPVKKDYHYWIGLDKGNLGSIRGGHCVCLQPKYLTDLSAWWDFYDQGQEGACVGFGTSRVMTLLNRKRYLARWLWDFARLGDEFSDNDDLADPEQGTTVRSAAGILLQRGHVPFNSRTMAVDESYTTRDARAPSLIEGVNTYRWARSTNDILTVLQLTDQDWVPVLNSWGRSYPHVVRLPVDTLDRLIFAEDGEAAVFTDR